MIFGRRDGLEVPIKAGTALAVSQAGWPGRVAGRRDLHHEAPPAWSRLSEGPSVAGSGTLKRDLKGYSGQKGCWRQWGEGTEGNPHDGLIPGYVVSHSCSFPALS